MRDFYLMNQSGEIYYLNYKDNTLATDISGLGFEKNITYLKYESEYKKVKEDSPISSINMKLIFLDGYRGYSRFINYLKRSSEFKLYYKAYDLKFCDIDIPSLTKGELISGTVQSNIKMDKLSLWQKQKNYFIKVEKFNSSKKYPYTYSYTYSKSSDGIIKVENNGTERAPLRIEINGAVNVPEIVIRKEDEIISKMKLYIKSDNCKIIVDSSNKNQIMQITDNDGTRSIYELQDFSVDNFLFINPGIYELDFKPGVSTDTSCKVVLTEFYIGT